MDIANFGWLSAFLCRLATPANVLGLACLTFSVPGVAHDQDAETHSQNYVSPQILSTIDAGVGEVITDFEFTDIRGNTQQVSALLNGKTALVIAIRDVLCPVSSRYAPRLAKLERKLAQSGVAFLFLNPNRHDDLVKIKGEIDAQLLKGPYVHDPSGQIALTLQAKSSSEVFLLDQYRELIYRGAIDDQYGIGYTREEPLENYLLDAWHALSAGELPGVAATSAPGCFINPIPATESSTDLTYHKDIAPIVQTNCQPCHRPGESGPFPFLTYEDVAYRSEIVRFVLQNRVMPPWFAAAGSGPWKNNRSLSNEDREKFLSWINNGAPPGNPSDTPPPVQRPQGWQIGDPDLVIEVPETIEIPAEGLFPYQYVTVDPSFDSDQWVQRLEVRSSTPSLVHHILVYRIPPDFDYSERLALALRGMFAVQVPGNGALVYPDGMAKRVPAGHRLLFQIHYQPNGVAARDRPKLGLTFAQGEPEHEVFSSAVSSVAIDIPANDPNHRIAASKRLKEDTVLLGFLPHMHARGKAFQYQLKLPNGEVEEILQVPRYNFDWQMVYELETPRLVPKGTEIIATGWYDNSRRNPRNPDPSVAVYFGPNYDDEMMIGYFDWIRPERVLD